MKGSRSWLFVCGIHGVASSLLWWARDSSLQRLTWHYDTVWSMPWTLWTSAWVHVNPPHLIFSQMGLGLLKSSPQTAIHVIFWVNSFILNITYKGSVFVWPDREWGVDFTWTFSVVRA